MTSLAVTTTTVAGFEAVSVENDALALTLVPALGGKLASLRDDAELIGDALPVIRLANAALSGGQSAQPHAATFLALAAKGRPARIRWIKREQNLAGIALASRHPR